MKTNTQLWRASVMPPGESGKRQHARGGLCSWASVQPQPSTLCAAPGNFPASQGHRMLMTSIADHKNDQLEHGPAIDSLNFESCLWLFGHTQTK